MPHLRNKPTIYLRLLSAFFNGIGQKRTLSATHDIAGNQRQADDNDREPYDDKKTKAPSRSES
jgi:hypothetical protein